MPVRDSNELFLEVLTALPATGLPLEVDVYSNADYTTMLDTLQDAYEVGFLRQQNVEGTGSFKLNRNDPKATDANLAKDNLIKIKINGVYRFAFFLEEIQKVTASPDEGGGEELVITGRGALAYLDRDEVYPATWPSSTATDPSYTGATKAKILSDFITLAKGRGGLPALTYDFTATADSQSQPWTDSTTDTFKVGTDLLSLAKKFAAIGGFDIRMDTNLRLSAYVQQSVDRTASVVFAKGRHLGMENVQKHLHNIDLKTRLLVLGQGGSVLEITRPDLEALPGIGRRAGFLDYSSTSDPQALSDAGNGAIDALWAESEPLQVTVNHGIGGGLYEPFVDYDVGDIVALDVLPDYDLSPFQIVAITIGQIEGGDFKVILDLNAFYLDPLSAMKQQLGNTGASSSGGGSAIISSGPGSTSGNGKVSVVAGDAPGYLVDKLVAGSGVGIALVGSSPDEQMEISTSGLTNPMTTQDDIIVAGAGGTPSRLAKGSSGYVLTVDPVSGHLAWDVAPGFTNPMITADDLIVGGTGGAATRLGKGADGQVLTVDPTTHLLVWATPAAPGMSNPMTTQDDLIVGGAAGAAARLGVGSSGQVLTVDPVSGHLAWDTPASGFADPTTTKGDLIVHGGSTTRLPVGSDTQVLTADSTQALGVKWAPALGGGASASDHYIVGMGGQGDTDLTNRIVIPGLSGSSDVRAGGTNDDEFDENAAGVPTGWTSWNLAGTATVDTNAFKSHLHIFAPSNAGTDKPQGIQKAAPTIPYTVTVKVSDWRPLYGNYTRGAVLFIMDGTSSGPLLWFAYSQEATERPAFIACATTTTWGTISAWSTPGQIITSQPPMYLRAIVHSATNIDLLYSRGGKAWTMHATGINPGLASATYVGLGTSPHSQDTDVYFDFCRFS